MFSFDTCSAECHCVLTTLKIETKYNFKKLLTVKISDCLLLSRILILNKLCNKKLLNKEQVSNLAKSFFS